VFESGFLFIEFSLGHVDSFGQGGDFDFEFRDSGVGFI
jgi:hypothetical protein